MKKSMLSPSMMCVPQWQDIQKFLQTMQNAGVELLHIDVMDGQFVPNLMLGTESIRQLRRISPIPLDIHLMVESPDDKLPWFDIQPGEYVSVHAEATRHLQRVLSRIRNLGARPIVALNPATSIITIEDILPDVDGVLLMTVNPGFAGQQLIPQMINKISRLRKLLNEQGLEHVSIEVDGNVSFENAVKMRAAGADIFVCGTASIFSNQGTMEENIRRIRSCTQ